MLKKSNSSGIDGLIIRYINYFVDLYTYLINIYLERAKFSDILQITTLIPLYKTGEQTHIENVGYLEKYWESCKWKICCFYVYTKFLKQIIRGSHMANLHLKLFDLTKHHYKKVNS